MYVRFVRLHDLLPDHYGTQGIDQELQLHTRHTVRSINPTFQADS
ncbi:hypothetical protein C4K29_3803 [Pseudomonas chlororaphis subsp. piscium]|nr:hypothetical protein C4K29_3803 [Pseudomonas chlororaphis subsp. piscium]